MVNLIDFSSYLETKRTAYFRAYRASKRASVLRKPSGSFGELWGLIILINSFLVRKPTHDLIWGDYKVEVKTSLPREGTTLTWEFHLSKSQKRTADLFLLVCLSGPLEAKSFYLIPRNQMPKKTLRIGLRSREKYKEYEIKGRKYLTDSYTYG